MPDRRVRRMLRIEGSRALPSGSCRVMALVAAEESGHLPAAGWVVDRRGEYLSATSEELEGWHAAAITYLGVVADAEDELRLVQSRRPRWRAVRRLPFIGGRVANRTRQATQRYLDRVRVADAAYQPSRRQVEQRLVEHETERREHARQQWERQQARLRAARAEFEEWRRGREAFAAAADLQGWGFTEEPDAVRIQWRATGSLTTRELAATLLARTDRGLRRQVWDSSARAVVESVVGPERFAEWWDDLRATVRNCRARDDAIRAVVDAIGGTSAALEAAGRPGISPVGGKPTEPVDGWQVDVDWSTLPAAAPYDSPPQVPVRHRQAGEWYFGTFEPTILRAVHRSIILTPSWPNEEYRIAELRRDDMHGWGTRHYWHTERPAEFAEWLFRDEVDHQERWHHDQDRCTVRLTEHADPDVYVPYVHAVADAVVRAITTLAP